MNKTKKSGLLKIAGLMAAVTMLTTCVVSGTMAKYTSEGTISGGTLSVAKWDIEVNGNTLEDTVDLSSLSWTIAPIAAKATANNAVEDDMIAPGTWGYASFTVENKGNVDVTLKVTGDPKPSSIASTSLVFKLVAIEGAATTTSYDAITTDVDGDLAMSGITLAKTTSDAVTIYICYQWTYDAGQDEPDTTAGTTGGLLALGNLTINATQVEPDKGV